MDLPPMNESPERSQEPQGPPTLWLKLILQLWVSHLRNLQTDFSTFSLMKQIMIFPVVCTPFPDFLWQQGYQFGLHRGPLAAQACEAVCTVHFAHTNEEGKSQCIRTLLLSPLKALRSLDTRDPLRYHSVMAWPTYDVAGKMYKLWTRLSFWKLHIKLSLTSIHLTVSNSGLKWVGNIIECY